MNPTINVPAAIYTDLDTIMAWSNAITRRSPHTEQIARRLKRLPPARQVTVEQLLDIVEEAWVEALLRSDSTPDRVSIERAEGTTRLVCPGNDGARWDLECSGEHYRFATWHGDRRIAC